MHRHTVVALLLFVAFTAGLTLSSTLVAQNQDTVGSDRLTSLKQEHINTLQSRVEAMEARFKIGTSLLPDVISARIDLLDAKFAFAQTHENRVRLLQQKVETLREKEQYVNEGQATGLPGFSPDVALLAKAERLRAEIALVTEQASEH